MSRLGRGFTAREAQLAPAGFLRGGMVWWVAIVLTIGGLGLGFGSYLADEKASWEAGFDSAYRAFRLIFLEQEHVAGEDLALQAGRWMAAIGAATATLYGLLLVFSGEVEQWRATRRKDHVVVVGLGDYGSHLARSFAATKGQDGRRFPVVGIEIDPHALSLSSVRGSGIPVLVGDAADARVGLLDKARIHRALYLVVTCGDDGRNAEVAMLARRLLTHRRRSAPLTAFVHLDDLRLWPQLKSRAVSTRGSAPFREEFFNVVESASRILLDTHRPFPRGEQGEAERVLLVGLGSMGQQVLLQAAQRWDGWPDATGHIAITAVAPDASRRVEALCARHPRLAEVADVTAVDADLDLAAEAIGRLFEAPPRIAYVCAETDADGLAAGLTLRPLARACRAPVVVVVKDDERGLAQAIAEGTTDGISVFGMVSRALPPWLLVRGTNEVLARVKHAHYLEMERLRGVDARMNPSARPWDELPESLRESNRAFADKVGEKLEALGYMLVPDPFATSRLGEFSFDDDEVELLARMEHDRWREDLERDGWQHGDLKDPDRKRHPLLVDWADVPEGERAKDYEPVAALPAFLARVGFVIQRAQSPPDHALAPDAPRG